MKIFDILKEQNVGAFWVTNHDNKRYFSNFSGTTSEVVITQDKVYFITDGRYATQVKSEVNENCEIIIIESNMGYVDKVVELLSQHERVAFETSTLTVERYNNMKAKVENCEIIDFANVVEKLRLVKTEAEIDLIKKAVEITDKAYSYVIENVKPGMTEMEVKLMAENQHMLLGAESQSFSAIVAAGVNGAKPHANASDYVIQDGDMVTLDFGCFYKGYCSDMTRSFVVGETPNNEEIVKIHELIQKTMNTQIEHVKAGKTCFEIDKIGRDMIAEAGYDGKFIHGTGHGIGLEIHEAPTVTYMSDQVLEPGMTITIEPGIYIEGLGGIRIEQDVVVRENGCEVLNKSMIDWKIN